VKQRHAGFYAPTSLSTPIIRSAEIARRRRALGH
jgi:hypothetical protein